MAPGSLGVLTTPGIALAWMTVAHPVVVLLGSVLAWTGGFLAIGAVAARRRAPEIGVERRP